MADQATGRTALVMGIIMIILGLATMVVSITHTKKKSPAPKPPITQVAGPAVQVVDDRVEELEKKLRYASEKLAIAEDRLNNERSANDGIRKELNEMRLGRQEIEAQLQSVAAERLLEKKTVAALQADLEKTKAGLSAAQEELNAAKKAADAAVEKAKADAVEAVKAAEAKSADELSKTKKLNEYQGQLITSLTNEKAKLQEEVKVAKEMNAKLEARVKELSAGAK